MRSEVDNLGDADRIFVFHGARQPDYSFEGIETVYVPWKETEMYRTFYPLLGQPYKGQDIPAITDKSLLVVDEMLMTRKRGDLKYNCTHHFLRVSSRRLVFNYYPFIEEQADFMILLDYAWPDTYKMQPYDAKYARLCSVVPHVPDLSMSSVKTTDADTAAYEKKRDGLFDNLGQKDPDTIPRALILQAGKIKARAIQEGDVWLARNRRIKNTAIITYADDTDVSPVYILDPTYKRRDFIEFMRRNNSPSLIYFKTGLPVDDVYFNDLLAWIDRLEAFYAESGIRK